MATTTFVRGTKVTKEWLNDANYLVYTIFNGLAAIPSSGKIFRSNGTNAVPSTFTLADTYTAGTILSAATANTIAGTASPTLGASGTLGSLIFGNATSGLLTLQTVTGALGAVTVSLPAATDTLVGKATTDVLTNKTLTTPVITNATDTTQALTDQATITWDANSGCVATVTLAGNRTFAAPTNLKASGKMILKITQDATGGRTVTWNGVFKTSNGQAFPQPDTTASNVTLYEMFTDGTNLYLNTSSIPSGTLLDYAGTAVPAGFLGCDGTAVSRTTYAALFAAISTTWGVGNGSTTFNVPNFQRRSSVGSGGSGTATLANTVGSTGGEETHALTIAELAAHTHGISNGAGDGAGGVGGSFASTTATVPSTSTGSGTAHNTYHPSAVVLKIIKY